MSDEEMEQLAEQLARVIAPARFKQAEPAEDGKPKRKPGRTVEDAEFVAMIYRLFRALEDRAMRDPALVAHIVGVKPDQPNHPDHVPSMVTRLSEIANVVIAASMESYRRDVFSAPSMIEMSKILGIAKQSASERAKRGREIITERVRAAGAIPFAEAKREREVREAATKHVEVAAPQYVQRRALRAVS